MALLPPPDIGAAYVDEANRPSKDFYNWIKSLYDYTRNLTIGGGGGGTPGGAVSNVQYNAGAGTFGGYTNTQVTALLDLFTSSVKGVVPSSGGGSTNFLRADGTWTSPGGSGAPGGSAGQIQFNNAGSFGGYTNTQVTALLDTFTNSLKGVVPASGGGTTNFLRSDGTWAVPPGTGGGGGAVSSVSNSDGSLTIFPITGAVVASMNMAHQNTWTTGQTFTRIFFGTADGFGINDTSSLLANTGTFWDSNLHRFNRAFVGAAATIDANNVPQSPTVMGSAYSPAFTQNAQLGVMSSMGMLAILCSSRASDWVAWFGGPGGPQGITAFGINDDTTTSGSIAVGGNLIGVAVSGAQGITLGNQCDINSRSTPVTIDPFSGFPGGTTIGMLSTSGAYSTLATQNTSAAYVVDNGGLGLTFNAGLVFMDNSISRPGGAKGVAIALPRDYAIVWYTSAGVKGGSAFVDSGGNFNITAAGGHLIFNGVTII